MEPLTIGKVARLAGVGVETIRFYEREGLIEEPPRGESGYRQYSEDTVHRFHFNVRRHPPWSQHPTRRSTISKRRQPTSGSFTSP